MNKKIVFVIGFILGAIIISSISVYATLTYNANIDSTNFYVLSNAGCTSAAWTNKFYINDNKLYCYKWNSTPTTPVKILACKL